MGATSVTGKGPGSAEGLARGPRERNFVGVEKLIGPRVVLAAQVTLAAGAATYNFPEPFEGGATSWNVFTQADNAVTVTKTIVSGDFSGVVLAGTGTDVVDLIVVNVGHQNSTP
jgi:hypothetical protein